MDYTILKQIHVACAVLSYFGFVARGAWMIRGSSMLRRRWVGVAPHIVDTALLASAIALAAMRGQYPFVDPWLTAKVVALGVYIGLGMVALRYGSTLHTRVAAWVMAQIVFAYIMAVALTKNPFIIQ